VEVKKKKSKVGGNEKRSEKCVGGKLKRFINK
jgi:hypothetical protein